MFAQKSDLSTTVKVYKTNCHAQYSAKNTGICQNKNISLFALAFKKCFLYNTHHQMPERWQSGNAADC